MESGTGFDWKLILQYGWLVFALLGKWIHGKFKAMTVEHKSLAKEVDDLRLDIAKRFVPKDELRQMLDDRFRPVHKSLDQIWGAVKDKQK